MAKFIRFHRIFRKLEWFPSKSLRSDSHGRSGLPLFRHMSVTDCLSSANDLLAAHASLVSRVRTSQKYHRRQLAALPSPPQSLLKLDLLPSPPPSPSLSPPGSPVLQPKQRTVRPDLPPAKKARVAKYQNYVPEEETIRNDYSQRYVDGGEWPQNWVLGADPARRFEESALLVLSAPVFFDTFVVPGIPNSSVYWGSRRLQ